MRYLLLLLALCWTARGANPSFGDFNANQFATNGNKVAVKSGATMTNLSNSGLLLLPSYTPNALIAVEDANEVHSIPNAAGFLHNDGSGGWLFTGAISQNGTNGGDPINFTNSATVTWARSGSNWTATAASGGGAGTTNIFDTTIITNNFFVSGKGNTLIVTQYVRFPWTTLTMSGSNVSTIDLNAGSMFKLTLTNNAFFGAPSNLPGTNLAQTIQIALLQDGTGTRTVTLTNAAWLLNGSSSAANAVPTINTNANGLTVLTFVTSPFSATQLLGVPATIAP